MLDWLAEGTINPVIAKRLPLVEARQAQELILEAKVTGKIVLMCNEGQGTGHFPPEIKVTLSF